ncbi:MAG TPA: GGDEF domain-containing protein [Candidatus Woesearchaeota archaeon]|nr:GGDEF domain-containing protein [Candidatus Woesearchaeota archaeon]
MRTKPTYEELEKEVAELKRKLAEATRDPITGLYTRAFYNNNIDDVIQNAAKNKENIGVLFLDIDDFRKVNKTFGHQQGDKILRDLAKIINFTIKSSDYVIRWGGDEILILLPKAKEDTGKIVTDRITSKIKRKYNPHNKLQIFDNNKNLITYSLSVSTGYAYGYHTTKESLESTIQAADKLMREEKNRKKPRSKTTPSIIRYA